jgi:hypothetical protein
MSGREKRRIRKFVEVEPEKRQNPNSIRRLFFQFIDQEFDKDCRPAAAALSSTERPNGVTRSYQRGLSEESLYNFTRDRRSIDYATLDAFARYHNVPLSLVLLFTRIHSELEDENRRIESHASRTIAGLRQALNKLEEAVIHSDPDKPVHEQLNYGFFQSLSEEYLEIYNDFQGMLPFGA